MTLRLTASVNARRFYEVPGYTTLVPHEWEIYPGLVLPCMVMEKTVSER
jgi:hypothetical protein